MATVNQAQRQCTVCGGVSPATEDFFYRKAPWKKADGTLVPQLHSECKVCSRIRTKAYYKDPKNQWKIKPHEKEYRRAWYAKIKDLVFKKYGGWVCACCGEAEPKFLVLDHVNNDGNEFRKKLVSKAMYNRGAGSGGVTYAHLVRNGYPPGYQVLCSNCNHGKAMNGGICPHVEKAQRSERQLVG